MMSLNDPVAEFASTARNAGLEICGHIVADGKIHRCQIGDDRKGKKNGWYVLHLDGIPAGAFGSWKLGVTNNWCAKRDDELTPEQIAENKRRMAEARKQREREEALLRSQAKEKAEKLWVRAGMVNAKHGYVVKKAIRPAGAKQIKNMIVLPHARYRRGIAFVAVHHAGWRQAVSDRWAQERVLCLDFI
jgi:putative DNA primase/helicase